MAWINIGKPSVRSWTNIQTYSPIYDEADLTYDSPTTFYDGINQTAWTKVPKPTINSWSNIPKPT